MTAPADQPNDSPKKGAKLPLLIGLLLCLLGAGGGFHAVSAGVVGPFGDTARSGESVSGDAGPAVLPVFVALDPLVISLPGEGGRDHLHFTAQLEVSPGRASEIEAVKPRIVDALNSYLRAVEVDQLDDPAALMRMRAHMLRRVQVVAGQGRVKDLLIMEFVLS